MKIVLLIAPFTFEGHYQSWLSMISKLCLGNGYKVIYFDNVPSLLKASFLYKLRYFLLKYLNNQIILIKLRKTLKILYKNVFYKEILSPRFNINTLASYEKSIDFIFFLNLDFLDNNFNNWNQWIKTNSTPWAGISLYEVTTPQFKEKRYLSDPHLKAIFSLRMDKSLRNPTSSQSPPIMYLPEITQNLLATDEESLRLNEKILRLANGRPIIILCGSIESRKNIKLFLEASQYPRGSSYFFILAGKNSSKSITQDDKRLIKLLISSKSNVLVLNQFFNSESTLNSIINVSNYIFAAYIDFDQSSNMLAKSAALKKPIFVTKNSYMAYVVKKYGMGYEIDNSIESLFSAIDLDIENPIPEKAYSHFLSENNIDKFTEQLLKVLPK